MNPTVYAAESAGWAALGFACGFLAGLTFTQDGHTMPTYRFRLRFSADVLLGVVVLALAVLTVVQGIAQDRATQRLTTCLSRYSNTFADALDARQRSAIQAQLALDDLVLARSRHITGGPDFQAAVTTYLARRDVQRADQHAHPYPPAPRNCPRT